MDSSLVNRSLKINRREVSVTIERDFWDVLEDIAVAEATTTSRLVSAIVSGSGSANLASAIRTYILEYFQAHAADADGPDEYLCGDADTTADSQTGLRPRRWLN